MVFWKKDNRGRQSEPGNNPAGIARDERGGIIIYVALIMPFLMGLTVLVIDAGRLFNLDTSLQNNVDSLALAGASELDRRADSHVRACRAMQNLVTNDQLFVASNETLSVACDADGEPTAASDVEWTWLASLPPDHCDLEAATPAEGCEFSVSLDPSTTFYIRVKSRVVAADFTMILPTAFVGGTEPAAIRRSAVAGLSRTLCQPTPMMICNPWEATGLDTVTELRTMIGTMTSARQQGNGENIGPGLFGLLDPGEVQQTCDNSGGVVDELTDSFAGVEPSSCTVQNGLCPQTGVVATLDKAVNARFDMFDGAMKNRVVQNPELYPPAARTRWNTETALTGANVCKRQTIASNATLWYPRTGWYGNQWNNYFRANPNRYHQITSLNANSSVTLPNGVTKPINQLTRYETYQWEVQQASLAATMALQSRYATPPADTCYARTAGGNRGTDILTALGYAGRASRRDVYVSIANCLEIQAAIDAGAEYRLNGTSTVPLPSLAVAKMFITEPMNVKTFNTPLNPQTVAASTTRTPTTGLPEDSWPASCEAVSSAAGLSQFSFDLSSPSMVPLVAGRTYTLVTSAGTLSATLSAGATSVANLAAAFTASAAAIPAQVQFCTDTDPLTAATNANRLYMASGLADANASYVLTDPADPWPSECAVPDPATYGNSGLFYFDLATSTPSLIPLVSGQAYTITSPEGTIDSTLGADGLTMDALASGFASSASTLSAASPLVQFRFCAPAATPTRLYMSTANVSNSRNAYELSLLAPDAKNMQLELVDVFAPDSSTDVTRDVVRLYR